MDQSINTTNGVTLSLWEMNGKRGRVAGVYVYDRVN